MSSVPPRVRFAPSPTGIMHVGGVRSALFNWVAACQSGGTFVLRIEDTDASRNRPEWTEGIISALAWLGISGESERFEGPYFQSANRERHTEVARELYESGRAYYCGCTRDDVIARTGDSNKGYDGHCRDLGLPPGEGHALRFRTPDEGVTVVDDLVRGKPEFANALLEDFAIARGDGSVLFLLANVVDDLDQGITLVARAEEHLPNTPKQQLLWEALGAAPPTWAHLPVIVNEKRQKLSKRRDKVGLEIYQREGYIAPAVKNYLMLLGWAPGDDQEIVPWETIEERFRLTDVNTSAAFFDERKLRAFNGEYLRAMSPDDFAAACLPWLTGGYATELPWRAGAYDQAVFMELAPLAQTRVSVLGEVVEQVAFAFVDEPKAEDGTWYDAASWQKAMKAPAAEILRGVVTAYESAAWDADSLRGELERVGTEHGLKLGKSQAPVRVAVTGRSVGLPLFESLVVLGRERTLSRLRTAEARLAAMADGAA